MNKSNNIADEKVFPQVMVDKNTEKINGQAMSEFSELTVKPAVQNRPVKIIKMEEETNGIVFELETEGRTDAVGRGQKDPLPKRAERIYRLPAGGRGRRAVLLVRHGRHQQRHYAFCARGQPHRDGRHVLWSDAWVHLPVSGGKVWRHGDAG